VPAKNAIQEVAEENFVSRRNTRSPGEISNQVSIFPGKNLCSLCQGKTGDDSDFETSYLRIESGVTEGGNSVKNPKKNIENDLMNHLSGIKIKQKFSLRQLQGHMSFVSEFDTLGLAKTHGLANHGLGAIGLTKLGVLNHTPCTLEEKFNYFEE
jgi:hypothetical protein